jgi:putative ABC transport system permease protein
VSSRPESSIAASPTRLPLAFPQDAVRNFHYLSAVARLKPGVSLEQAQSEMSRIAGRIAELYPDIKKDWGATVDRWLDRIVGPQLRLSLIVLMSAVGLVLLIGCANLANLLLARATMRSREISVRAALGASRRQVIRQLLTESLLLCCMGGIAGLVLGVLLFRGILSQLPPFSLPAQAEVGVDLRVAGFLAALTILTTVLFGLAPAIQASRRDPVEALKEGGRGDSASRRKASLRNSLVVSQVALAFLLVSGAGLLIRSFSRLTSVDPGFDTTGVVTMGRPGPDRPARPHRADHSRQAPARPGDPLAGRGCRRRREGEQPRQHERRRLRELRPEPDRGCEPARQGQGPSKDLDRIDAARYLGR